MNFDSGNAASASAWIVPTLPQPMMAVLTGSMSGLAEMLFYHAPQESQRLGHLVHAVHAILDADPALVVVLGQDAENGVVIVEPLAGDAVAEVGRVAERTVALSQIIECRSFS